MRLGVLGRAAILALLAGGLPACARVHARTEPAGPALDIPAPPPRVVVPAASEPIVVAAPPVEEVPAPPPPPSPARAAAPRTGKPAPAATAKPSADTGTPPRSLQTTVNLAEAEQQVRSSLARAAQDLGRIDYRTLGAEARAQYDIARRFISQAENAMKDRNVVFALTLAEKAETLASLLLDQ